MARRAFWVLVTDLQAGRQAVARGAFLASGSRGRKTQAGRSRARRRRGALAPVAGGGGFPRDRWPTADGAARGERGSPRAVGAEGDLGSPPPRPPRGQGGQPVFGATVSSPRRGWATGGSSARAAVAVACPAGRFLDVLRWPRSLRRCAVCAAAWPWRAGKSKKGKAPPYMRGGAKRPRVQNPAESISPQRWESSGRPRCRSYRRRPFGWGGWGVSPPQRSLGELDIVGSFLLGWADLQSPYLTLRWRGALRALIKTPCWTPAGRVDGVGVSRFHESSRSLCSRIAGGLSVLRRGPLARWPNHVVVVGGGSGVASEPFSRPPPGTGGTQCPSRAGLRPHGRSSTTTWRGLPPSQVPKSADHADGRGSGCRSLDQCPFRARPITVDASGRSRCRVALQLHPRGRRELHFHAGLSTSTWSTAPADVGSDCCSAGFVGREVEISWGKVATWSGFPVLAPSTAYPGRAARRLPQACGTCTLRRHYCGCSARRCSSTWSCSAAAQRPSCPMKNFTDVTVTLIPTPRRGLCDRRHHPRARASRCSK